MPERPKNEEIQSLNRPFLSFDLAEVGAEELERRLELAIAHLPIITPSCDAFACGTFACGSHQAY